MIWLSLARRYFPLNAEREACRPARGRWLTVHCLRSLRTLPVCSVPGIEIDETCVVQVKSFEGEHWDTKAVSDIRRAFNHYPEAKVGLIISTAEKGSEALDRELEKLQEEGKSVTYLCCNSAEVAALFLFVSTGSKQRATSESVL